MVPTADDLHRASREHGKMNDERTTFGDNVPQEVRDWLGQIAAAQRAAGERILPHIEEIEIASLEVVGLALTPFRGLRNPIIRPYVDQVFANELERAEGNEAKAIVRIILDAFPSHTRRHLNDISTDMWSSVELLDHEIEEGIWLPTDSPVSLDEITERVKSHFVGAKATEALSIMRVKWDEIKREVRAKAKLEAKRDQDDLDAIRATRLGQSVDDYKDGLTAAADKKRQDVEHPRMLNMLQNKTRHAKPILPLPEEGAGKFGIAVWWPDADGSYALSEKDTIYVLRCLLKQ
jgi:hypothetical protein